MPRELWSPSLHPLRLYARAAGEREARPAGQRLHSDVTPLLPEMQPRERCERVDGCVAATLLGIDHVDV